MNTSWDEITDSSAQTPVADVYTVSRLNAQARDVLAMNFPTNVWVSGEMSNLARPSSGHLYFTLKDEAAQVRCAMFRQRNNRLTLTPGNGIEVIVRAKVSLYEGRGEFQLIVEHMDEAGAGALQRAFDLLKQRLAAEGLFAPDHKFKLPRLARCIGVVTSPSGAAIRDILSVIERRFPAMPVIIYPTAVQGNGAAEQIAGAIYLANQRADCDVLIIARGGGSLEDLWSFNEEVVARAIYNSTLPIVTGVGHEVDFSIADFVADQRAPTPSAAAELLTPDQDEWRQSLHRYESRLANQLRNDIVQKRQAIQWLTKRLQQCHPQQKVRQHAQRLDELEQRLIRSRQTLANRYQARISELVAKLHRHTPDQALARLQSKREQLSIRLHTVIRTRVTLNQEKLTTLSRALDAVSPLATLSRGYAVVTKVADKKVVQNATDVSPKERIVARLKQGQISCTVDEVHPDAL